ncbi:MAG: ATP-dependent Clp protease proteolytic subunit [Nanoarchaeota archaeon]|nr:ATP-dependent Clp protease proteolytic subunit [Nanoarchaeota archaeon]MBU1050991.1 ATP-dependent Clp protease proteolytic subunit [Nanoarchaeota archaeon]MBU1988032.1 ATP-dependent Clp protease proteolytic subunit [Nanoarchaeota archaeon]
MAKKRTRIRYTQNDIDNFFEWGINLKNRIIYLSSISSDVEGREEGVNYEMAEYAIKGLALMGNTKRRITILMNNIGGDWFHGMAIYDAIRRTQYHAPVDIEVYGHAMSMGAVILQAGRKRLMHPNSALMIHDGRIGRDRDMHVRDAENWGKYESKMCDRMYDIFAERSGHYRSFWKKRCSRDTILTPEETVDWGLADGIIESTKALPCVKRKRIDRKK